jgi:hypothetical protein
MLLKIFVGPDNQLESEDDLIVQEIRDDLWPEWERALKEKGIFTKDGAHYSWAQMLIFKEEST